MATKYFRRKQLTMWQQALRMRTLHPQFAATVSEKVAIWIGNVKPLPLSDAYTVQVRYETGKSPKVSVLSPPLLTRKSGQRIPHTYKGDALCLYLPRGREWHPNKFIAETIIPWISLWLLYYEGWLATGDWFGGGIHPEEEK